MTKTFVMSVPEYYEEAGRTFEPSKNRSGLAGGEIPFFDVKSKLKQKA
jgi:hypothetical protein